MGSRIINKTYEQLIYVFLNVKKSNTRLEKRYGRLTLLVRERQELN